MSADLYSHAQRLNIALTELMASAIQIEALVKGTIEIKPSIYSSFFERSAVCIEQVCAMQEEVVRLWQDQIEKGKETQA